MSKLRAIIFVFLTSISALSAQLTTEGTDFWFGFMDNDNAASIEVYISARQRANVTINSPLGGFSTNISVAPNTTELVDIPLTLMPTTEGLHNMGIHVTSDTDITVYTLNKRRFSADAAVILPTNVLGQEYYVVAHKEPPGDGTGIDMESEVLIVATEENTEIQVTPSVDTFGGWRAGETRSITLDAGETYQLKSTNDLTGTFITNVSRIGSNLATCKKIAVFGGNKFTNVGGCGGNHDHLIEQMFPVPTWGREYLFVPYETRTGGDYVKIMAAEDDTEVTISGLSSINLNKGEVHVIKALDGVREISGDKPIQVAQFSRSTMCDGANGDPFMIMISPLEQRVRQVTFDAFQVIQINQYYLTLITEASAVNGVELDGVDLSSQFTIVGNAAYLSIDIAQGTHTLVAPDGVIAYVYGYGTNESFGYSAGVSLQNLNLQIEGDDEQIGILAEQGCVNSEVDFNALFDTPAGQDPRYDTFSWDFGDGNTSDERSIKHTYDQPGTYTITLVASKGVGACSNSEVITRELTVTDIIFGEMEGPVSVCPDVTGIEYNLTGSSNNTYEWSVFGGTISGSNTGPNVFVDWGAARDDAWVKLTVRNSLGCAAEELHMDVKINKRLEPADPMGDSEVCFLDRGSVTYSTTPTNGSEYEWFVSNGIIISDNTSNSVEVQWDGVGTGEVWYREYNPLISDCEGFSDRYQVTIYSEIVPTEVISNVTCNGESDGSIGLNIVGGKGEHSVVWSNGQTGKIASNLVAGTYTATITDDLGCETTFEYEVTQPDVLQILAPAVTNVRCFQESNGSVDIAVQGGTAPYSYTFTGDGLEITQTTSSISGLPSGDYRVTVTDANNCVTSVDFFVDQPDLLEADLERLINQPICPQASDGVIEVDAKGGVPAYQFFWETNPTVQGNQITGLSQGSYTVRIVDANNCEATFNVDVKERFPRVFIPSAFSPNNDGENDEFIAVTDCNLNFNLQVFNKWGSVIFTTNDIAVGWDGTVEGEHVPDGIYSYKVFYSGQINEIPFEETINGTVRIFR